MSEFESSRRLPVYLVLDVSGSMEGEPIQAVNAGLKALEADLQANPRALKTAWLSVITFSSEAQQVIPLTKAKDFTAPTLATEYETRLDYGLQTLLDCIDREVVKAASSTDKGDWYPLVFIFTDGQPTDEGKWQVPATVLKQLVTERHAVVVGCAAGPHADDKPLKYITEFVVHLKDLQQGTLERFFAWVSQSVASHSTDPDDPAPIPEWDESEAIID